MPEFHAKLSPSGSERWIQCPASIRMEQLVERKPVESPYALEGTQAHTLGEIKLSYYFDKIGRGKYLQSQAKLRNRVPEEQWDDMDKYTDQYVDFVVEKFDEAGKHAAIFLERRVNTGVPECWGTADTIIVSPELLHVIDLKYGQGVVVGVEGNPQLRLYGLGALDEYDLIGGVEVVSLSIFQPRVKNVCTVHEKADDLREWRDHVVIPVAEEALGEDEAHFGPSESACRFCAAAGECRPRMNYVLAQDFGDPNLLTADDIADALHRLRDIREWCKQLEETALEKAYSEGVDLPGWKVVRSGGIRRISDTDAAIQLLEENGFPPEEVSRVSLRTLKDLDRAVGEERLQEILGELLAKTPGRESLVPEDDKRPAINPTTEAIKTFENET